MPLLQRRLRRRARKEGARLPISVLQLPHYKYPVRYPCIVARLVVRPFDHDRAGQAREHLRLHLAVHVRVIPVQPGWHVRRYLVVVGDLPLAAHGRPYCGVRAAHQHLILRGHRRHGEPVHMQIRAAGYLVPCAGDYIHDARVMD